MKTTEHKFGPLVLDSVTEQHPFDVDICLGYDIPGEGSPILIGTVFYNEDGGPITPAIAGQYAKLFAAAPDLVEALDNVTAIVETLLAHYGSKMPAGDLQGRTRVAAEARKLVDSLLRK